RSSRPGSSRLPSPPSPAISTLSLHDALPISLLDEAGYQPDVSGKRMSVRIAARALYPHYKIAAEVIARELAKLGIDSTIESLTPVEWAERVARDGDFDLAMEAGDIGPDPAQLASFLASDGPRNIMRYKNEVVDE